MRVPIRALATFCFFLFCSPLCYAAITAPVSGFARSYPNDEPIANATVTVLENGMRLLTDSQGKFGPFYWPVGETITLTLEKIGFHTTQTGTIKVPAEGLTDPHHNITFQVPSEFNFYLLAAAMQASIDSNKCHVVTTVTARGKTMADLPQGEEGAKIILSPSDNATPFYLGMFTDGPLKNKTNPLTRGLTATSLDGGVIFFNLTPRNDPYFLTAEKDGIAFNQVMFFCRKGMFVNLSPPQGPTAL